MCIFLLLSRHQSVEQFVHKTIVCVILGAPYGPGQPAYNQYPAPDQYGPPPQQGQYPPQPNQFPPNAGQRGMYPPYGPPAENES